MNQARHPLKVHLLCSLLIILSICLFWWRMTLLGLTPAINDPGYLYEDYFSMIPAWKLISLMVKAWQFPLWSPYSQGGMLLLADQQYTIAYPLIWVNLFFNTQHSFALVLLLNLFISSVALYFLMIKFRVSPAAALCSSFIYVFSFPVTYGFLLCGAFWTWHLFPPLLLLLVLYLEKGNKSYCFLLAGVWGMQMCTFIQCSYNLSIFFAAFTIYYGFAVALNKIGLRRLCRRFGAIILAVLLGTCLAAVHLIPLFEFSTLWKYRQFTYEEAAYVCVPLNLALEFLLSAKKHQYGWWALVSYMGTVGIIFSLYALTRHWRNKIVLFFASAIILIYLLALGGHTPLYRLFFNYFPGANFFHHPIRFLWAMPVCLPIVAGFGVQAFLSGERGQGKRSCLLFFACFFVLFTAICVGKRFGIKGLSHVPITLSALQDISVYSFAVLFIIYMYLRGYLRKSRLVFGLLGLIFIESYSNTDYITYFDFNKKYSTPGTVSFLRKNAGLYRFISYNKNVEHYLSRFMDDDAVPMIYPELSNYFQLYDIQCRGPLQIKRYANLMKAINRGYEFMLDVVASVPRIRDYTSKLIDLFGVKYIVSKGELTPPSKIIHDSYWSEPVKRGEPLMVCLKDSVKTSAVILESFLESASRVAQGEDVAIMTLWLGDRKAGEFPLRAGVHTAEGFQLNDAAAKHAVRHSKVLEAEWWEEITIDGKKRKGTLYRGVIELHKITEFDKFELRYIHPAGRLRFRKAFYRPEDYREILEATRRRFRPVFRDEEHDIIIYENSDVLPRAFLTGCVEVADSADEALESLLDKGFDLSGSIIIEEEPPGSFTGLERRNHCPGKVEILSYSPNNIEMRAVAGEDCFLFISDAYYPGWETIIDGKKTKTYRADYAFRAAYIPAGEHMVVMRYRPKSFLLGALISLLSIIVVGTGLFLECIRTKR